MYVCMYEYPHTSMCAKVHLWRSEYSLLSQFFSFYPSGLTQAVRFGGMCLYPWSFWQTGSHVDQTGSEAAEWIKLA